MKINFKNFVPPPPFKLVLVMLLMANACHLSFADEWVQKADMPTARADLATCVLNDKIVAFGGSSKVGPLANVEEYDPITDKWTKSKDMPTPKAAHQICLVNGKVYIISNVFTPTSVIEYDPLKDIYTGKEDMPTARMWPSACTINGLIYVFSGTMGNGAEKPNVEEYNPSKDE